LLSIRSGRNVSWHQRYRTCDCAARGIPAKLPWEKGFAGSFVAGGVLSGQHLPAKVPGLVLFAGSFVAGGALAGQHLPAKVPGLVLFAGSFVAGGSGEILLQTSIFAKRATSPRIQSRNSTRSRL